MQFIRLLSERRRNEQQNNVVCVCVCVVCAGKRCYANCKGEKERTSQRKKEIYILDQGALGNTTTGVM